MSKILQIMYIMIRIPNFINPFPKVRTITTKVENALKANDGVKLYLHW